MIGSAREIQEERLKTRGSRRETQEERLKKSLARRQAKKRPPELTDRQAAQGKPIQADNSSRLGFGKPPAPPCPQLRLNFVYALDKRRPAAESPLFGPSRRKISCAPAAPLAT
jgi:hypothetical protein